MKKMETSKKQDWLNHFVQARWRNNGSTKSYVEQKKLWFSGNNKGRNSPLQVFLGKGVQKIWADLQKNTHAKVWFLFDMGVPL